MEFKKKQQTWTYRNDQTDSQKNQMELKEIK